jgi:SAM-dependent methyltransferase
MIVNPSPAAPEPSAEAGPLRSVAEYYSARIRDRGATPAGVDWNSSEGQTLRFAQLLRLIEQRGTAAFSLDDYGCGYGALLDHMRALGLDPDYLGLDVADPMITAARAAHPGDEARFLVGASSPRRADFAVASGILNVKLGTSVSEWEHHVAQVLDTLAAGSTKGFAFNCLSTYSDPPYRKDHLYYADPKFYFDLAMRKYGRKISLIHDYGLYEFTLLVRK